MRQTVFFGLISVLSVGCLDFEKTRYVFHPKKRTGEMHLVNIGTGESDPASQADDFNLLVKDYINGPELKVPEAWHVTGKELYEENGHLNGVVYFTYDSPEDVLTITTDKNAYWKFCAPEDQHISAAPKGTLDGTCMTFKKKEKHLVIETDDGSPSPPAYSLIDEFRKSVSEGGT